MFDPGGLGVGELLQCVAGLVETETAELDAAETRDRIACLDALDNDDPRFDSGAGRPLTPAGRGNRIDRGFPHRHRSFVEPAHVPLASYDPRLPACRLGGRTRPGLTNPANPNTFGP